MKSGGRAGVKSGGSEWVEWVWSMGVKCGIWVVSKGTLSVYGITDVKSGGGEWV